MSDEDHRFLNVGVRRAFYDAKHRSLSIEIVEDPKQPVATDVEGGLLFDYDADGTLVGVEALLDEPLSYEIPGAHTRTGCWPQLPVIEVAGEVA